MAACTCVRTRKNCRCRIDKSHSRSFLTRENFLAALSVNSDTGYKPSTEKAHSRIPYSCPTPALPIDLHQSGVWRGRTESTTNIRHTRQEQAYLSCTCIYLR
jgi:hypothetical protein